MSIDTTMINQSADLLALVGRDVQLRRVAATKGGEWAGPCPFCGGRDRFRVWPEADKPGWWCRQCERNGDAIAYLMQRENLSFQAACEQLGPVTTCNQNCNQRRPFTSTVTGVTGVTGGYDTSPTDDWQARAWRLVDEFEANLWGDVGAKARAWLAARGLWEETSCGWRIGYCPKDGKYDGIYVDRGIVIPWLADDMIWKLNVRRPVGDPTYRAVKGSKLGLYGSHRLTGKVDCIITEGEFDALLVWQELGDLADVLTLGGALGHVAARWLPYLLPIRRFWIATDNDEAGHKAADYWLALVGERSRRILPPGPGKDITEGWQGGADLRAWLSGHLGIEEG